MSRFQKFLRELDEEKDTLSILKESLKKSENFLEKENEKITEYLKKRGN